MTRPLRRAHRLAWMILAPVLGMLLVAALLARSTPPAQDPPPALRGSGR